MNIYRLNPKLKSSVLSIFCSLAFVTIFLSCSSNNIQNNSNHSKIAVIENLQLELLNEYNESINQYQGLRVSMLASRDSLFVDLVSKQLDIIDKFDVNFNQVISGINNMIINLFISNQDPSQGFDIFNILEVYTSELVQPIAFNVDTIVFLTNDVYPSSFDKDVLLLKNMVENLRLEFLDEQLMFYNRQSLDSLNISNPSNFVSFRQEFLKKKSAYEKSNTILCFKGEEYKVSLINIGLTINENRWNNSFTDKSDIFLTISNLLLLQKKLLYNRTQIFSLFDDHRHCQSLKWRDETASATLQDN